jgi:hypothetical protein
MSRSPIIVILLLLLLSDTVIAKEQYSTHLLYIGKSLAHIQHAALDAKTLAIL